MEETGRDSSSLGRSEISTHLCRGTGPVARKIVGQHRARFSSSTSTTESTDVWLNLQYDGQGRLLTIKMSSQAAQVVIWPWPPRLRDRVAFSYSPCSRTHPNSPWALNFDSCLPTKHPVIQHLTVIYIELPGARDTLMQTKRDAVR